MMKHGLTEEMNVQLVDAWRERSNEGARAAKISTWKLPPKVRIHVETAMPQRRERRGEMLGALHTRMPIRHRQENYVGVIAVFRFNRRRGIADGAARELPAFLEIVWAVVFSQAKVEPFQIIRAHQLLQIEHLA